MYISAHEDITSTSGYNQIPSLCYMSQYVYLKPELIFFYCFENNLNNMFKGGDNGVCVCNSDGAVIFLA